ncbi:MAG: hypothetical protein IEMM0008_0461 [bacterium]|nr:MAG: hypothetical protein IEMM0008_0461 [bacterium]
MIQLSVHDNEHTFISFCVEGHSTVGKKGNNLLCAGVSTLTQSILLSMKSVLKLQLEVRKEEGYIECIFPKSLSQGDLEGINLLMMTMITGFQDLKRQFPEEISIIWPNKNQ